ncbi:MAG TPA: hypothetical protein PKD10_07845 [Paracoccaceae bacterium]|nr:hypothetical protein [Paracoccaceae bacterium]HMO70653.1 hypothetical protein [Paracoccaceae bacterium]
MTQSEKYSAHPCRRPNGLWLLVSGDPPAGDADIRQVSEDDVLTHISWRARERLGRHGPDDGSVTWHDVPAWLRESHI